MNLLTILQKEPEFNEHGHVIFPIVLLLIVVLFWRARVWVGNALSETHEGKKVESSKRLVLFMIALTYAICSILVVFKSGIYSSQHKLIDACLILLLAGVITFPQLISAYRRITGAGGKDDDDAPPAVPPSVTTTTTTEVK